MRAASSSTSRPARPTRRPSLRPSSARISKTTTRSAALFDVSTFEGRMTRSKARALGIDADGKPLPKVAQPVVEKPVVEKPVVEKPVVVKRVVPDVDAAADDLFERTSFRKNVIAKAVAQAPRNAQGELLCPTCGVKLKLRVLVKEKDGGRHYERGFDLDHYPVTWAARVRAMRVRIPPPSRSEVLDEFNRDLRVQCGPCNQSHRFEGKAGTFFGVPKRVSPRQTSTAVAPAA